MSDDTATPTPDDDAAPPAGAAPDPVAETAPEAEPAPDDVPEEAQQSEDGTILPIPGNRASTGFA